MQMLLKIDNIKSRMKDASDALRVIFSSLFNQYKLQKEEYFHKQILNSWESKRKGGHFLTNLNFPVFLFYNCRKQIIGLHCQPMLMKFLNLVI